MRRSTSALCIVVFLVLAALAGDVGWHRWGGHSDATSEITPTAAQQAVIKEIAQARDQAAAGYKSQLAGAIQTIMRTTIDPATKKPLDPKDGWQTSAINPQDLSAGIKFVKPVPAASPSPGATPGASPT